MQVFVLVVGVFGIERLRTVVTQDITCSQLPITIKKGLGHNLHSQKKQMLQRSATIRQTCFSGTQHLQQFQLQQPPATSHQLRLVLLRTSERILANPSLSEPITMSAMSGHMRVCSRTSNVQKYRTSAVQQKRLVVHKHPLKTLYKPSEAPSSVNVATTASPTIPAQQAPIITNGDFASKAKSVHTYNNTDYKDGLNILKHSQLFPALAVLSAATALADAGPFGWGGMLFLSTAVASWLAPVMTKAITTYATSKVTEVFRSYGVLKPSLPFVTAATSFAPKPSPLATPLIVSSDNSSILQAEGGDGPQWLPAGSGVCKPADTVPQLPKGWGARKTVVKVTQLPTGWGVRVHKATSSTAVTQASESAPSTPAAAVSLVADVVPVKAAPRQVQPAAAASCASSAPGGEAHAAEQVAMPVSSTMRPALLAICLRLTPEENRKQPGGLVFTSGDLAIAPGGYWCNPGNAERLVKTQGQVQNRFLPASAADDSGLPRVEVSSMSNIFKQQWKALRVYATTPDSWPAEGKVVTYGDLKIVAAYGIQG